MYARDELRTNGNTYWWVFFDFLRVIPKEKNIGNEIHKKKQAQIFQSDHVYAHNNPQYLIFSPNFFFCLTNLHTSLTHHPSLNLASQTLLLFLARGRTAAEGRSWRQSFAKKVPCWKGWGTSRRTPTSPASGRQSACLHFKKFVSQHAYISRSSSVSMLAIYEVYQSESLFFNGLSVSMLAIHNVYQSACLFFMKFIRQHDCILRSLSISMLAFQELYKSAWLHFRKFIRQHACLSGSSCQHACISGSSSVRK